MKLLPLALTVLAGLSSALVSSLDRKTIIVWNITPSVPVGLYVVTSGEPRHGSIALVRLTGWYRLLAKQRGYLPGSALLIKPVLGLPGDLLCRQAAVVTINGRFVALARKNDATGLRLPSWQGCRRLNGMQMAVISRQPGSFDSRYFGPIDRRQLVGLALALWTKIPATLTRR